MGAALLSWVNWLDKAGVTLTGSSEAGTLGVNRLAQPQLRRRWRTALGDLTPGLQVDLGQDREVGVLALAQPDDAGGIDADGDARGWLAPTDTVRHRLDAVTLGAGALLDTGADPGGWQPGYGVHLLPLGAPVTARYWQADLDAASLAALDYVDLGRAWIGPCWRPARGNISYGWSWVMEDGSTVSRNARSGLDFVDQGPRQRVLTFGFSSLTEADAKGPMRDLLRIAGLGGQVLFAPLPEGGAVGSEAIIGRLVQVQPITQPTFATFAITFQIRQSL